MSLTRVRLSTLRLRLSRLCGLSTASTTTATDSTRKQSKQRSSDKAASVERSTSEMDARAEEEKMEQSEALRDFIERVDALSKNNFSSLNLEFVKLRNAQEAFQMQEEYSMTDGFAAPQNRYRDVVPYNKNRICLKDNDADNDYINASLIKYPPVDRTYIAAQAPLPMTIGDFWHMIGQYKVRVVVMLCNIAENSISKCVQYWPIKVGEIHNLGYGTLETIKEEHFDHFTTREILFKSERFGESTVYQLHYTEWPDHGCPDTELHIPKFIEAMDDYQVKHGADAPILVHCSAGVGRTGSVIGVDIFRTLIRENKIDRKIDLKEFVLTLRKQRTAFVQSVSQYQLLHTLVAHYCKLALANEDTTECAHDVKPVVTEEAGDQPNGSMQREASPKVETTNDSTPQTPEELVNVRF